MFLKRYVVIPLSAVLLFACDKQENKEEEYLNRINELEARQQALQSEVQEKDSTLMTFMESIAEIEKNLREIRARELNIELASREGDLSPDNLRSQINEDITVIDRLIRENKRTINALGVRLRQSNEKNQELTAAMAALEKDLTQKIEEREYQITLLKDRLDDTQATVKELLAEVDSLVDANEDKIIQLNTAYYVTGDYKELKEEQILNKEGGFLGLLGRTEAVRDDYNKEKFTRIDIRETVVFPVQGKDIELITLHPAGSYTIEKKEESEQINLVVSNPDKFWESSKYLVMMVK